VHAWRGWLASRASKTYTFRFEPPNRVTFSESQTSDPLLSISYDLSSIELSSIGAAYIGFTGASHCTVIGRGGPAVYDAQTFFIYLTRQVCADRGEAPAGVFSGDVAAEDHAVELQVLYASCGPAMPLSWACD